MGREEARSLFMCLKWAGYAKNASRRFGLIQACNLRRLARCAAHPVSGANLFWSSVAVQNGFGLTPDLATILHEPLAQSGAKATALQTLVRLPVGFRFRAASGVRRVHRRFWIEAGVGSGIG
jgi:hypothetical protein